jgi:hypothetical protein
LLNLEELFDAQRTSLWHRSANGLTGLHLNIPFNTREYFGPLSAMNSIVLSFSKLYRSLSKSDAYFMDPLPSKGTYVISKFFLISDFVVLIAQNKDWHEPHTDNY